MRLDMDQMTPKRTELFAQLGVGARVYAKKSFSLAVQGDRGWVTENYELGGRPGVTVLFENGQSDGFAPGEVELLLLPEGSAEAAFMRGGQPPRSLHEAMSIARSLKPAPFPRSFGEVMAQWEGREIAEAAPEATAKGRGAPRI